MEIAFVSGGSSGIGLATVRSFLLQGMKVVTCGRSEDRWLALVKDDEALSAVDFIPADCTDESHVESLFEYIKSNYGHLNYAVNNASPDSGSNGVFQVQPFDALRKTVEADLISHMHCLKKELEIMGAGGCIVNVSSVNGIRPTPGAAAYSAAKHGLEGLTRSVALEAIKSGVRVNSVAPGVTWTPRWERRQAETSITREDVSNLVPIGRFADAAEIASAIQWLCSKESSYVVGHTLVVEGGVSLA